MKPANYSPTYVCLYPQLAEIARSHGYALAAHGTMARDFDLVAIPWVDEPSPPQAVVDEMVRVFALKQVGAPVLRQHGRLIFTMTVLFGECFLDLSFMPVLNKDNVAQIEAYTNEKAKAQD